MVSVCDCMLASVNLCLTFCVFLLFLFRSFAGPSSPKTTSKEQQMQNKNTQSLLFASETAADKKKSPFSGCYEDFDRSPWNQSMRSFSNKSSPHWTIWTTKSHVKIGSLDPDIQFQFFLQPMRNFPDFEKLFLFFEIRLIWSLVTRTDDSKSEILYITLFAPNCTQNIIASVC